MVKQYPTTIEKEDYTFEEYLLMEEQAEYKSEYQDGKIVPIESATNKHAKITSNCHYTVQGFLRKRKDRCSVYDSSLKVFFEEFSHGVYPDVMVICGDVELYNGKEDIVVNPLLVIEVLSPATSSYDRGEKFMKYRSLPAFKEYMLISQDEPQIETWYKMEENIWRISHASGLDSSIHLFSLDIDLPLTDIYYLVDFSEKI
jgi:Uma2 family endonuclease